MNQIHIDILKENLNLLNLSAEWVRHSFEQTKTIEIKTKYTNVNVYCERYLEKYA